MSFKIISRLLLVVAVAVALFLLYRTLRDYSLHEILRILTGISRWHLLAGLGFAAGSYLCLGTSDFLATRYAGKPLPFRQAAIASFTSLSIGHNVGFAALSSGAVRFRFYSRWGLTTEDVAKIIFFCGMTVGLGLATLGGACFLFLPDEAATMLKLGVSDIRLVAGLFALFPVLYLLLSAFLRKPLRFRSWEIRMPTLRLALAQILIGTANFACVSASLHQMLSAFAPTNYFKVAAASITANIAAIISHVPGGLGVLEATVVHILPGASSIAAIIAFRTVYYFIPLAFGIAIFIASEAMVKSRKAADETAAHRSGGNAGTQPA